MNVLLISGSPRKNGNTEVLLNHASSYLKINNCEVVKFYLSENNVKPCEACDCCSVNHDCKLNDDMKKLYGYYKSCDGLIIGTPVYFRNVSAQLKAVFDRTYAIRNTATLSNKIGGAISVGKGSGGGQCLALSIIYNFFLSCGAICVPGELNGISAMATEPGVIIEQKKRLDQVEILCNNMMSLYYKNHN